ncbi:MAG: ferritin family protein [Candidatus Cloacimonetes bacterium]|nr:ferritin family protein [Candidatus Cloacimonadota bacterium]
MNESTYIQTIDSFIQKEKDAERFYQKLSDNAQSERIKKILHKMALEEAGHALMLEELKKKPISDFVFTSPEADMGLAESTERPKSSDSFNAENILKIAMKREEDAVNFYRDLKQQQKDPVLKDICQQMINMELQHKNKLENEYLDFLIEVRTILSSRNINITLKDLL